MRLFPTLLAVALVACGKDSEPVELPLVTPGPPVAGAAEGYLSLPVGTPMGGYSSRCGYLGSASSVDSRDSAYTTNWDESTGVHTLPRLKVVWLANGDEDLILVKADVIYSFDGLVAEIADRLSEATGRDLTGRVVLAANHSHASFSNFSDQVHFYLGGDRYNEEIFQRFAAQATELALEALEGQQPVSIGTSWTKDWDPDDLVYRDRRGDNDDLAVWDDVEPGMGKDPYVHMVRIDTTAGDPIAVLVTFGIHGTLLGDNQSMVSGDAPAGVELGLEEQFDDQVVVVHLQGAGGDASPAGVGDDYARVESIGEIAGPMLRAIWESTPTSTDPIRMETASRHIPEYLTDIRVTRAGTVDWYYPEADPDRVPDDEIFGANGEILSPLDEFNAPSGAAFCGSDEPLIPAGGIGSLVFPYSACMDVDLVSRIMLGIFDLEESDVVLPLPESLDAGTTASRIGPLLTLDVDGTEVSRDLLVGFFPAEPTAMFTEQWRRRVADELGYEMPLLVGYAQDHEGYFLIPEDWLRGGYEPNINLWGPLQAEHVMEGVLEYADYILGTDEIEPPPPLGLYAPTEYPERPLPELAPDLTPDAGTLMTALPDYMWLPLGGTRELEDGVEGALSLEVPAEVPRVQGVVQLAWLGGDPAVDLPHVVLERDEGGEWVEVTSRAGRLIDTSMPDILLAHTPDPLYPAEAEQVHRWWAAWQAVGHSGDRVALPLGSYRLRVDGARYTGGATTWPWPSEPYTFTSAPFEVVPAEIAVELDGATLWAWLPAPAALGWRFTDVEVGSDGGTPVRDVTVIARADGAELERFEAVSVAITDGRSALEVTLPGGTTEVEVIDGFGNSGVLAVVP
jgi:neutral ceramidase